MRSTPEQRLARLARHARAGYVAARADAQRAARALGWLSDHPSPNPALDAIWRDCLHGRGPLAAWLASEAPANVWTEAVPLHSLLASHPFPDLALWSIQATFRAS